MTCEGRPLNTLTEEELLGAKAYHETSALVYWERSEREQMHKQEKLALSIVGEMVRRTESDPTMIQIRKRLSEQDH